MAFLRVKRIRGHEYAYLVESRWDAARGTSRQVAIKYLGPADRVRLEDVPAEHRTDAVRAFLLRRAANSEEGRGRIAERVAGDLAAALMKGDRRRASEVSRDGSAALGLDGFYVDALAPAMHRIGELWRQGEISIAVEHLASNLAAEIVDEAIAGLRKRARRKGTVALCTPPGEEHQLATKVLEGLLLRRGHGVLNISASAPLEAIVGFLESRRPDAVLISVTIGAHLPSARRLVRAVQERLPSVRLVVGGQGVRSGTADGFPPGTAFGDSTLAVLDGLGRPSY